MKIEPYSALKFQLLALGYKIRINLVEDNIYVTFFF